MLDRCPSLGWICLLVLATLAVLCSASGVTAAGGEPPEGDTTLAAVPVLTPVVAFIEGTAVEASLATATSSSAPVPVIIILRNQPARAIADEVQGRYLPQVREKNQAVRSILARYAGPRDLGSVEAMRAQADREVAAVTPADRAAIKSLNHDADATLDAMRKELSSRLQAAVAADQSALASEITAAGGKVNYKYAVQNSVAAMIPGSALIALSRNPLVSRIVVDRLNTASMDVSGPSVSVGSFWTPGYDGGIYDGAIMDTGVDTSHPGLDDDTVAARTWYSQVFHATAQGWSGYNDNSASTDDLQGHGTHVAGTVFSSDATNRGIAFGADVGMNLKAGFLGTDGKGHAYDSDVMAALDWSWQQAQEPEAVNYSFGADAAADDDASSQYFDSYVEYKAVSATIAAGNSGPGAMTVETPGIAYNVITVANMNDLDTTSRTGDTISGSSSHGPTRGAAGDGSNGRRKPDISAPGTSIMSANNDWEGISADYVNKSGTSMAAPHVAGAALLLGEAGVTDPREIKALLINTADDWGAAGWDSTYGWGYLDLANAYLHRADSSIYSVNERNTAGDYKLLRTTGMSAGERATMVWYRHAVYNGASEPTTVYALNDLNLRLYDETNNALIDSDTGSVDNVHQVQSDRSGTQVIRAYAWSTNFSHGSNFETFALAYQEGTTLSDGPVLSPSASNYTPPLYAKFTATVSVHNAGDVAAHNVSVTLTLPAGVVLASGSLTQNLGTVSAGSTAYAYYELDTTSAGAKTVSISASSSSYGLTFTGDGSFLVTPDPQDLVDPYTVMRIGQPTYQAGGTEKIANGGFESDLAGWATSGTAAIEAGSAHGGSKNLKLGPGTGNAYQSVSIGAGATPAVLTFWYKAAASIFASAGCSIQDSVGNTLVYPFSATSSHAGWTKVTIDLGRFRGQTIRANFYSATGFFGGNSTLYLDDVSLKESETVWVDDTNQHSFVSRDDNSGVDYTEYHVGADPFTTYSLPFTLAGKPESYNYIYYRSADNGANIESTITGLVYLDTQAPKSVLTISSPWSLAGGTEKVSNPGFESALAGWTASGAAVAVGSPVRTGTRAAMIGGSGAGSIYQDVPISVSASRAFLRCYVKSVAGAGSSYIRIALIDPETGLSCYGVGFNYTADWTEWAWDVSRFKGSTVRVQFDVFLTSGGAATAYIDDVTVRDNGDAYVLPSNILRIYSAERCGVQSYESKIDAGAYTVGQAFSISTDGLHTVRYRATDNLDHLESDVITQFNVDQTGPTGSILINSGAQYATSANVNLTLSASDPAGVSQMRLRSDTGVWGSWQAYQSSVNYTFTSSAEGTKNIGVEYKDALGNVSATYSDTIELRQPVTTNIPGVKQTKDGKGVRVKTKIVTAIFPTAGYFYIEEPDRTSGIRVRSNDLPSSIDSYVTVEGVTATVYAEHEIIATLVQPGGAASAIQPLGVTNKSLGGGAFYFQPGVPGSSGLNNIGLLVRTTGQVVRHLGPYFYINDRSPIVDSWPPETDVLVDARALGGWKPPVGSYVAVTGASGMETLSGSPIRTLRPREIGDVQIYQAKAAYVYLTNVGDALSFKSLLDTNGLSTDVVKYDSALGTDWSNYHVVLIGSDTGGWTDMAVVNAVLGANTPVVAIGLGGAKFLDAVPGLFMGWGQCAVATETTGVVVGGDIYTYPHDLGVGPGASISVYHSPGVTTQMLYDPSGVSERMLRSFTFSSYYPVAREAGRYYLWGYYGSPAAMDLPGRNLFVNLVSRSLLP